jgi:5-formyltetrahydrofolate cyclo-ligase
MVHHLKEALRRRMLAERDSLGRAELGAMSEAIAEKLFSRPRFAEAGVVAFYLPKGSETDTSGMIRSALKLGKEVLVPVTSGEISFVRFTSFADLAPGRFGIPEPRTRNPEPPREPDLVVVPGIAFGLCMHRLGYGRGYYDRYLARSPAYRVGVCYDFQVVERLPRHDDDQRMDEIITEKRIIQ